MHLFIHKRWDPLLNMHNNVSSLNPVQKYIAGVPLRCPGAPTVLSVFSQLGTIQAMTIIHLEFIFTKGTQCKHFRGVVIRHNDVDYRRSMCVYSRWNNLSKTKRTCRAHHRMKVDRTWGTIELDWSPWIKVEGQCGRIQSSLHGLRGG